MGRTTVFSQLIKFVSRRDFESSVIRHSGDRGVRKLDCWTWFGSLLFGQLSGNDSIRAVERLFCHGNKQMRKLGFSTVCRSTLADANHLRPVEILEDTFKNLLHRASDQMAPKEFHNLSARNIFLMDSTTIRLCLNLCPWAQSKQNIGGVKLHTAIDLAGELPQFAVITPAKVNDIRATKEHLLWRKEFKAGSTIVMDRAYFDHQWFYELGQAGVFFITRAKKNHKFKVGESLPTDRTRGYICDQVIYGKRRTTRRPMGKLRRVCYKDPDTGKKLVFITNRFDLSAEQVCALYKARWNVELFFKTLKQNLRIKKFLGTSENAVKAQILVALIAYILVQTLRVLTKTGISMPEAMAVVATLLLMTECIRKLLGQLPRMRRHPPPPQLSLNF